MSFQERDTGVISVMVVDDHVVVRRGLELLLSAEWDLDVVASTGDIETAIQFAGVYRPDVMVLDLSLLGTTSLAAIPRIREVSPQTQIAILTMHDDPAFVRRAFDNGARAYVLKEEAADDLIEAVHRVASGRTYLTPHLQARMEAATAQPPRRLDRLSKREVEVLRMIALGHTSTEIAGELLLSVRTIQSHRANIRQKLHSSSRAGLVRHALEHGLVDPTEAVPV
jgi:two-component system, NarL family, response regulator NreC